MAGYLTCAANYGDGVSKYEWREMCALQTKDTLTLSTRRNIDQHAVESKRHYPTFIHHSAFVEILGRASLLCISCVTRRLPRLVWRCLILTLAILDRVLVRV